MEFEILVVDNESQDNSKELITKTFPKVKWIQNSYNAGFGRANNLGFAHSVGKYVLLLNSDMLLLEEYDLKDCIEKLENDKQAGVLGCKLLNEDGTYQKSTYYDVGTVRYLLSMSILWYKVFKPQPKSFDAIMGSFMLFKREVFEDVKGFDPDFFMYGEELELCHRLKEKGYTLIYDENYTAIHKHGGSSGASDWSIKQNMLSNALLYYKINGLGGYFLYHFIFQFVILTNLLLYFKLPVHSRKDTLSMYKAYFVHFFTYFRIPFSFRKKDDIRQFLKYKHK